MKTYQNTTNQNRIVINQKTRYNVPLIFLPWSVSLMTDVALLVSDNTDHGQKNKKNQETSRIL